MSTTAPPVNGASRFNAVTFERAEMLAKVIKLLRQRMTEEQSKTVHVPQKLLQRCKSGITWSEWDVVTKHLVKDGELSIETGGNGRKLYTLVNEEIPTKPPVKDEPEKKEPSKRAKSKLERARAWALDLAGRGKKLDSTILMKKARCNGSDAGLALRTLVSAGKLKVDPNGPKRPLQYVLPGAKTPKKQKARKKPTQTKKDKPMEAELPEKPKKRQRKKKSERAQPFAKLFQPLTVNFPTNTYDSLVETAQRHGLPASELVAFIVSEKLSQL